MNRLTDKYIKDMKPQEKVVYNKIKNIDTCIEQMRELNEMSNNLLLDSELMLTCDKMQEIFINDREITLIKRQRKNDK